MKKKYEEIAAECRDFLDLLGKEELAPTQRDWLREHTVASFKNFINPGILDYRKSVSTDYTAVEWKGEGAILTDLAGKQYIDCLGGFGIYNCGHRHPKVVGALVNQLKRQALHSQELLDAPRALLAKVVADVVPGDLKFSFFTNSGAEAVERSRTGNTSRPNSLSACSRNIMLLEDGMRMECRPLRNSGSLESRKRSWSRR